MYKKHNLKQRLLLSALSLAMVFGMMPAMTMTAQASGTGTQQQIAISALHDGVGVGTAIDLKAGHGSDGNGFLAGYYPFNSSEVTTTDGIKYEFVSSNFAGNDSIQLAPGENITMDLKTLGAYQNIYVLATAGGVGPTTPASFAVTLTYTDKSTTDTFYSLYDWCNVPNPSGAGATQPFYRYATGTATADKNVGQNVRLYSKSINVDRNKLLKSITFTNSSRDVFALVFAVTGVTPAGVPDRPTGLTANSTDAGLQASWTAPSGTVSGYYIDVATDENFANMVTGYNNKQISSNTHVITGLTKGETYYYRVRAYNNNGQSLSSDAFEIFYTDPLPDWAKDAGLNDSNAWWDATTNKLTIKDDVTLTKPLDLTGKDNITVNVSENKTMTAPAGEAAIKTDTNLNIGGNGTIKGGGADASGNGSPAISSTGGSITTSNDSKVVGGDGTTGAGGPAISATGSNTTITAGGDLTGGNSDSGTGGNAIEMPNGGEVTADGDVTGGASNSGTGGNGITSGENVTVNGTGNITGGGSTSGEGGSGIDSDKDVTINGTGNIMGGGSTNGAGGNGITSGGNVTTDEGTVSGGAGTTDGGDGIKTTGGNSTVNTGTGGVNGGSGGSGTGGDGVSSTGDVTTAGNVSGGGSTSGEGGNGITSGGNVNTGEGDVSGGTGATDGGDGIKTTGGNSTVNTGTGDVSGGSGGTGTGGHGIEMPNGGEVTAGGDVAGGASNSGTGGNAIEVPKGGNISVNGNLTGGTSDSGTGGSGISSNEDLAVNGTGNITGGGSTNGTGGNGITSDEGVTVNGTGSITGGGSSSGAGGNGITSGGNVNTGEGDVSGGVGATDGGDGIKTTGDNSTVNTGTGDVNGGSGGTGTGGDGISSTGNVTTDGNVSGGDSTSGTGGNGITLPKDKDVTVGDNSKISGGTDSDSGDESGGIVLEDDGYTIDYVNEKITIKDGYTAKIKGSADSFATTVTFKPNTTYEIKKDGGVTVEFTTAARPNKPTLTQKQESVQDKKDGTIVGASEKMEYSTDGGTTWNDVSSLPLTGFSNETVSIRNKATHNTPCSEAVHFTFTESTTKLKVTFNANGGTQTSAQEGIVYGEEINVTEPTKAGYIFDGWYIDEAFTKYWGETKGKVLDNYTLHAKWVADSELKYKLSGNITNEDGSDASGATVEIYKGKQLIATTKTDTNGNYTFSDIPTGEYNIVITSGTAPNQKVKTILVTVGSGDTTVNVVLPSKSVSSTVEVKEGTPEVLVGGLDKVAEAQDPQSGERIELTLEVESKADENAPADEVAAIKAVATAKGNNITEFIDMTVKKTTTTTATGDADVEIMTNTVEVLEIIVPYDMSGKQNITVYRYHNGVATAFNKLSARPTTGFIDGSYYVGEDYIAIYTNKFSTYAVGYTTTSGGSGSSYVPTTEQQRHHVNPQTGVKID